MGKTRNKIYKIYYIGAMFPLILSLPTWEVKCAKNIFIFEVIRFFCLKFMNKDQNKVDIITAYSVT